MTIWDEVHHFRAAEFDYPEIISPYLVRLLDTARAKSGIPFIITSDVRPDDDTSSHRSGWAVDIQAHSSWVKFKIVKALLMVGINRIGVYDRHIHADIDPNRPADVMWTGKSEPVYSQGDLFNGQARTDVKEPLAQDVHARGSAGTSQEPHSPHSGGNAAVGRG